MIKFKEGPFKMAIEKQIDIIPVSIIGNHKIFNDAGVITGGPGKVIQYIHKPVSTKGLTMDDLEALKMQVFDTINNKLLAHGY
jgi:1-acyl-sn-glycerol-3-phosphate acyltransferase